jgi:hypothetical protein
LASIEGSIGMSVCLWLRSPNWRTRSTRPGTRVALGCRSGPTAPRDCGCSPVPVGPTLQGYPSRCPGTCGVDCRAGGLVCRRLPRSLTSLGGLVPARRRAQTQALSASVGRPGQPFPPSRPRSTPKARPPWQASPQARNSASPAAPPKRLANEPDVVLDGLTHRVSWCHRCQVRGAVVLTGHAISVPFRARRLRFATVNHGHS